MGSGQEKLPLGFSPKTKRNKFLGPILLLLSGLYFTPRNSGAFALIALVFSAILLGTFSPKTQLGVILLLMSGGWVLAMLMGVANSSADGNARAFALIALIFSAILWVPAFLFGLKTVTGGANFGTRGRAKQFTCPQCGSRRISEGMPCSSCGPRAHLQVFCATCGERREPHHKFCRGCGASASMT
jgi:hypothetical protein